SWAGQIVSIDQSPKHTAARRTLMVGFALNSARARAPDFELALHIGIDRGSALELDRALNLDRALKLDRALDRDIALALNSARALGIDIEHALARDRVLARVRAIDRSLSCARHLGSAIMRHQIITAERSAGFVEAYNTFDRNLTNGEAS